MSHQLHALFHRDWYETIERYQPGNELLQIVRAFLPATWHIGRRGPWLSVSPSGQTLPTQGWKIHVSANLGNCEQILRQTAAFCIEREVAFKFFLDTYCVRLCSSSVWPREGSSKFITIYPQDEQHFCEIIEALYTKLQHLTGPYILSDRRYKDSEVIYYRYGGIMSIDRLSVSGRQRPMLVSPQGELVPDRRMPYWDPPEWATDPFELLANEATDDEELASTLKAERYRIQEALKFSVRGGVYLATDTQTSDTVIIKEGRPYVDVDNDRSGADRLQREYELLQKLQETGLTPAPIDLFWDWEHIFLVEEYIPGLELGSFIARSQPLLKIRPDKQIFEDYCEKLKKIWCHLAQGIAAFHERGVVYGDISLRNILVTDTDLGEIRFIDLEAAWKDGHEPPTSLRTAGFISPIQSNLFGKTNDIYAFGALMLATLFPMGPLLTVDPVTRKPFVSTVSRDLRLSPEIPELIERCMSESEALQPTPQEAIEIIQQTALHEPEVPMVLPVSTDEYLKVISETTQYILASADFYREDRLFPADPAVFSTNPLSIAYGGTGVAYALSLLEGEVPARISTWLLSRSFHQDRIPPGLYIGFSGIAWALWEIGLQGTAVQILNTASNHPLLWDAADIFYGAAGYGLACLRFYLGTQDDVWLDRARQVGEWLLRTKTTVPDEGYSWPDEEGTVHLGYAQGASGIALYLLYLGLITDEAHFLEAGHHALAFDLAHLRTIDEQEHLSVPRDFADPSDTVFYPYWLSGSAGIATVLLRFWVSTGETRYKDILERLAPNTFSAYTVFPGLFQGLSGLGNFQLDAYQFTGEEHYLQQAHQTAQGLLLHRLPKREGIAFPGDYSLRISTDFGTGGAGIALFLHRLAHADQQQHNFNFTLDHLLPRTYAANEPKILLRGK